MKHCMFSHTFLILSLGTVVIAAPVLLVSILGLFWVIDRRPSEAAVGRLCQAVMVTGLLAALGALVLMLLHGTRHETIELGNWVSIPHYHFAVKFVFDRLSVPLVILSFLLCGTISAFANRYLHRESGYHQFFTLYSLFVLGMVLTSLAGTIETLLAGWELVGLSSVLLVAFYHDRPAPVKNGLRVWVVYRLADAALVLAAIVMHHIQGHGDFAELLGSPWPQGQLADVSWHTTLAGALLVIAAAGKSALVPFSGWLPRAMEGPTPSSAIFYGALSVHLGAFLLLRISPILEHSPALAAVVVILGLATALYAYLAGSVQSDIKSVLSFASLVQVGLIVAEIGLGLRYVALVHLLGNACLRTLQFIRAPSLLHDYHQLENAIGSHLPRGGGPPLSDSSGLVRDWLYRFSLARGYLDALLERIVIEPFVRLFERCDRLERKWSSFLSGSAPGESESLSPPAAMEDLP